MNTTVSDDTKQKAIEAKIDSCGRELTAAIALSARLAMGGKVGKFLRGFSESLGYKNHMDTAYRVMQYVYPRNTTYWPTWDERYSATVENSAWFAINKKCELSELDRDNSIDIHDLCASLEEKKWKKL